MRVLVNAISAKMGGAINYITELVREVEARQAGEEFVFLLPHKQAHEFQRTHPNLRIIGLEIPDGNLLRRLWFDQGQLRRILREESIDVLFSTANVGLLRSPCPQVLLVRNSLHFNATYRQRILSQKGLRSRLVDRLRRRMICASVNVSDVVLTPSAAMLAELKSFVSVRRGVVLPYGVNHARFVAPEKDRQERRGCEGDGDLTLIFTSLYSEHKNIGTLFSALLALEQSGLRFRLITTCDPAWQGAGGDPGALRQREIRLARSLERSAMIHFTGVLNSDEMERIYHRGDIFVYPSVCESFGHSLVEAMASGLPIIAADVPINREICGDAALYFPPFDPVACSRVIEILARDATQRFALTTIGRRRAQDFRWDLHFNRLLKILRDLAGRKSGRKCGSTSEPSHVSVAKFP